jgi:hypothetical protein
VGTVPDKYTERDWYCSVYLSESVCTCGKSPLVRVDFDF